MNERHYIALAIASWFIAVALCGAAAFGDNELKYRLSPNLGIVNEARIEKEKRKPWRIIWRTPSTVTKKLACKLSSLLTGRSKDKSGK